MKQEVFFFQDLEAGCDFIDFTKLAVSALEQKIVGAIQSERLVLQCDRMVLLNELVQQSRF